MLCGLIVVVVLSGVHAVTPYTAHFTETRRPNGKDALVRTGRILVDGRGRMRQEFAVPVDAQGETMEIAMVTDPGAGKLQLIDPSSNAVLQETKLPAGGNGNPGDPLDVPKPVGPILDLGTKTIAGLVAAGQRFTVGDRTIESWYAKGLDRPLVQHVWSKSEEYELVITEITLGEPDPRLFP